MLPPILSVISVRSVSHIQPSQGLFKVFVAQCCCPVRSPLQATEKAWGIAWCRCQLRYKYRCVLFSSRSYRVILQCDSFTAAFINLLNRAKKASGFWECRWAVNEMIAGDQYNLFCLGFGIWCYNGLSVYSSSLTGLCFLKKSTISLSYFCMIIY